MARAEMPRNKAFMLVARQVAVGARIMKGIARRAGGSLATVRAVIAIAAVVEAPPVSTWVVAQSVPPRFFHRGIHRISVGGGG